MTKRGPVLVTMEPVTATPTAMPNWRPVEARAPARPAWSGGSPETAVLVIGGATRPAPASVGSATLYRNFPTRRDLLEALMADKVDAVCAAASTIGGNSPGARLTAWLQRFFQFVTSKRPVAVELLEHVDRTSPVFGASRERVVAAGRPLLRAAQDAQEIAADLSLDQILDMVVAIAKIPGGPDYVKPILHTALAGLSLRASC